MAALDRLGVDGLVEHVDLVQPARVRRHLGDRVSVAVGGQAAVERRHRGARRRKRRARVLEQQERRDGERQGGAPRRPVRPLREPPPRQRRRDGEAEHGGGDEAIGSPHDTGVRQPRVEQGDARAPLSEQQAWAERDEKEEEAAQGPGPELRAAALADAAEAEEDDQSKAEEGDLADGHRHRVHRRRRRPAAPEKAVARRNHQTVEADRLGELLLPVVARHRYRPGARNPQQVGGAEDRRRCGNRRVAHGDRPPRAAAAQHRAEVEKAEQVEAGDGVLGAGEQAEHGEDGRAAGGERAAARRSGVEQAQAGEQKQRQPQAGDDVRVGARLVEPIRTEAVHDTGEQGGGDRARDAQRQRVGGERRGEESGEEDEVQQRRPARCAAGRRCSRR